jgi:hypothetical protein
MALLQFWSCPMLQLLLVLSQLLTLPLLLTLQIGQVNFKAAQQ